MSFDLYEKEQAVIAAAKALLDGGGFTDDDAREQFSALLTAYEKLLRSTRRLVRLSDRREEELNKVAKSLDEKNRMLEGLSAKLSKYLPAQLYKSIFVGEQDVSLVTKRKKLTVFFSDLTGFAETADNLQPEDLTAILNSYFSEMSRIALDHGATIDKFIGDAMLIFFGDPDSKGVKGDAVACVKMALAMQSRMVELRETWRDSGFENPFSMRIGINTGYCNVGNFGSAERMDYTIIGGEVNLAARLESNADPGGILISFETYAHVKDLVRAEERERMKVKGIAREILPYAVNGFLDEPDPTHGPIDKAADGWNLHVDLDQLSAASRESAIAEFESALRRLKARQCE